MGTKSVCVLSNRRQEYEKFGQKVRQAYEGSKKRYGVAQICRIPNDSGTPCSTKRVWRHMAEQGLRPVVVKNTTAMPTMAVSQRIKRIHSSIGYLTPQQKEDEELKKVA